MNGQPPYKKLLPKDLYHAYWDFYRVEPEPKVHIAYYQSYFQLKKAASNLVRGKQDWSNALSIFMKEIIKLYDNWFNTILYANNSSSSVNRIDIDDWNKVVIDAKYNALDQAKHVCCKIILQVWFQAYVNIKAKELALSNYAYSPDKIQAWFEDHDAINNDLDWDEAIRTKDKIMIRVEQN